MKLTNENHLRGITVESIKSFQEKCFTTYASSNGVKLGFDGDGKYSVRGRGSNYDSPLAENAISEYRNRLNKKTPEQFLYIKLN